MAINQSRVGCDPCANSAVCFCLSGASARAAGTHWSEWLPDVIDEILTRVISIYTPKYRSFSPTSVVVLYNDSPATTHESVMRLLDEAIAEVDAGTMDDIISRYATND